MNGSIIISAWQEGCNIHISVQDDGVGIPGNIDVNRATSLGLKLIRSLVQQLRGPWRSKVQPAALK